MNSSEEEKVTYIYNFSQINFYLNKGIYPKEIGVHLQSRKAWCKFGWKQTTEVYTEWCQRVR